MSGSAGDPDEPSAVHVWRRWTGERDVSFASYCRLWDGRPPLPFFGAPSPEGREPPLRYAPPIARWALRHTPLLILTVIILDVVRRGTGSVIRLVDLLVRAVTTPTVAGLAVMFVGWVLVLYVLIRLVLVTPDRSAMLRGVIVYGLAIGLSTGLIIGFYAAAPGVQLPVAPAMEAALLEFPWHFFWMLFFGGQLVYDGMLRTENLFTRLQTKQPAVIDDAAGYQTAFVDRLQEKLEHSIGLPRRVRDRWPTTADSSLPTAYLFSIVFVAPFYLFWTLEPLRGADRPLLARAVGNLVPAVLDFFLVVVFFQFLVLIAFFNRLLTDHGVDPDGQAAFNLQYVPDHPDGYAGFRDLGRFATRVNVILVVGGVYLAYQLSSYGLETYPGLAGGLTLEYVSWVVTNLLPLATYVLAVLLWLYLSFWQLHKTMRRGRERELERHSGEGAAVASTLRQAPVWPVDNRLLVSVLSLDLLPFVTLLPFVPT